MLHIPFISAVAGSAAFFAILNGDHLAAGSLIALAPLITAVQLVARRYRAATSPRAASVALPPER